MEKYYCSELLEELAKRLFRISKTDEMTMEDADELLVGAICTVEQFIQSNIGAITGVEPSKEDVLEILKLKVQSVFETWEEVK